MSSFRLPRAGAAALVTMTGGLIVWAVCFVVLYATLSVGCELRLQLRQVAGINVLNLLLTVLWAAHLPVGAWLVRDATRSAREAEDRDGRPIPFVLSATRLLSWSGLVATVCIGLPVLLLPACI